MNHRLEGSQESLLADREQLLKQVGINLLFMLPCVLKSFPTLTKRDEHDILDGLRRRSPHPSAMTGMPLCRLSWRRARKQQRKPSLVKQRKQQPALPRS